MYHDVGSTFTVLEALWQAVDDAPEQVLVTKIKGSKKCSNCRKKGQFAGECWKQKMAVVRPMIRSLRGSHDRGSNAARWVMSLGTVRATR